MPLESATSIESLDSTWPLGGDPTNKGDDHLRLIKNVLKTIFPGSGGAGFSTPITATESEINFLSGLTSNAQGQLDALSTRIDGLEGVLSAESATKLTFYQAAAPLGWTQDTAKNDHMLRIVSTAGGASGGVDSPILNSFTHTHATGDHSLSVAEMPAHTHNNTAYRNNLAHILEDGSGHDHGFLNQTLASSSTGGGAAHNHGDTDPGGADWAPLYIDVILASKD